MAWSPPQPPRRTKETPRVHHWRACQQMGGRAGGGVEGGNTEEP